MLDNVLRLKDSQLITRIINILDSSRRISYPFSRTVITNANDAIIKFLLFKMRI